MVIEKCITVAQIIFPKPGTVLLLFQIFMAGSYFFLNFGGHHVLTRDTLIHQRQPHPGIPVQTYWLVLLKF